MTTAIIAIVTAIAIMAFFFALMSIVAYCDHSAVPHRNEIWVSEQGRECVICHYDEQTDMVYYMWLNETGEPDKVARSLMRSTFIYKFIPVTQENE